MKQGFGGRNFNVALLMWVPKNNFIEYIELQSMHAKTLAIVYNSVNLLHW